METIQKLLETHPVYGLDKAICDYLAPILEEKLGAPFRAWRLREREQSARDTEATRTHGKKMVGKPVTLQEELLAYGDGAGTLRQFWQEVLHADAWKTWRDLGLIYSSAEHELRDMELMAAAQRAAEDSGDEAYAARVREIMALEDVRSPEWWPAEQPEATPGVFLW